MTLPALIQDFPPPSSPDYNARAALLGKQWPICWVVGNNLMRPMSTLTTLAYAYTAFQLSRQPSTTKGDWKLFALNAVLHVSVIVHSAVNMQPLNDKLTSFAGLSSDGKGVVSKTSGNAVEIATAWIRGNYYRALIPFVTGSIAMWQFAFQ